MVRDSSAPFIKLLIYIYINICNCVGKFYFDISKLLSNNHSSKTLGKCSFEVAVKYSNYLFEFQFIFTRFPIRSYSKKIWIFLAKTIQSCSSTSSIYILFHNMLNFHLHNCVSDHPTSWIDIKVWCWIHMRWMDFESPKINSDYTGFQEHFPTRLVSFF